MAKKKKDLNSDKLDIVGAIKSMNSKNKTTKESYDVNKDLSEVLKEILKMVNQSTNLNNRNVKPISILQCVPIWKNIVNNLVPNLRHIKNDLKNTLSELFKNLSEAIQNNNQIEMNELLNKQFNR